MRISAILAAVGLVLSLAVHVSTFWGVNPNRWFPSVWLLHLGIFGVWIPAMVARKSMDGGAPKDKAGDPTLRFALAWLRGLTGFFFVYAFFNFFFALFWLNEGGGPGEIKGELVLHSHGRVIRKLTPGQFQQHEAYEVRMASGHWMLFYSAALMMLLVWERAQKRPDRAFDDWLREPV